MSRHSHRRSRQSPAMVSPSSLLVTVLPPPSPGRLFLVWRVPPHCCSLPPQGLAAALTRAAFFGLEGPSSLLLLTTPGSCRRPHQSGFFWSGGSLLIAAPYHPRVLPPPSSERLFLVWRVPPHCCSLPPQGLVGELAKAPFIRFTANSQKWAWFRAKQA